MDIETMNSRLVVMMRPSEKKRLEARAKALKLSPSELVRRAAESYTPAVENEEALLGMFADEMSKTIKVMNAEIDRAFKAFDQHEQAMTKIKRKKKVI